MAPHVVPTALVLAAGEGRRMGGPKALLRVDGVPLVLRHLERLHEAGCGSLAVVVRPPLVQAVRGLVESAPYAAHVRVVEAETDSQSGSLAAGLQALLAGAPEGGGTRDTALLVTPVDLLPPAVATVRALLAALEGEALAATPAHGGRGGHPVVLRGELLAPFLARSGWPSLRDVLAGAGERRVRVEVDDAAVLGDLDTPSDVRALQGEGPSFVPWTRP
jgi:molybdenum cofactor cytidylyltransferase